MKSIIATLSLLAILCCDLAVAEAQNLSIPQQYVQQDQHNAHFLFGASEEVLSVYCNLAWAPGDARCYLEFQDEDHAHTNIFFRYENLAPNSDRVLARLKDLSARWKKKYPLDFWGRTVLFMNRQADHKALDELIGSIEREGLAYRVLMRRQGDARAIAYFYSPELIRGIFHIFIEAFSRYDLREGMWGPAEMAVYRDPLSEL